MKEGKEKGEGEGKGGRQSNVVTEGGRGPTVGTAETAKKKIIYSACMCGSVYADAELTRRKTRWCACVSNIKSNTPTKENIKSDEETSQQQHQHPQRSPS